MPAFASLIITQNITSIHTVRGLADTLANTSHFEQEDKWVHKFRDLPQKVSHWGSIIFIFITTQISVFFSFVKLSFSSGKLLLHTETTHSNKFFLRTESKKGT